MRGQSHLIKVLLDTQQVNSEALDKYGQTPLHIACKKSKEDCIVLLLQFGAPPNLADFKGNRPLHAATKPTVARWLVAFGARLELANQFKKSCKDAWGTKLDKYVPLFQLLTATDCRIQTQIAPNTAWFDDKLSNSCLGCGNNFTVWSRRHHCRACGLLVCQPCSNRKLQFNNNGKPSLERSCDKCFNKNMRQYTRKKNYNFRGRSFNMMPHEYFRMTVMETSQRGSYQTYMKFKEEKENDLIIIDDEEKKESKDNVTTSNLQEPQKNGTTKNNKGHKFSNSVNSIFGGGKKKKDKNNSMSKHQTAQSEAMNQVNQALSKVNERGEKLSELADKSERMSDDAKNFNDLAKQ
eukprot:58339_1